jgi:hypothetical protein
MNYFIFNLFLTVLIFSSFSAFADSSIYTVESGDNLHRIVQHKLEQEGLGKGHYSTARFKIMRYNPNIQDWNNLQEGTKILLSSTLTPALSNHQGAYLHQACRVNRKLYQGSNSVNAKACQVRSETKSYLISKRAIPKRRSSSWNLTAFYTYSLGSLKDTNNGIGTSSTQNSPFTLGLATFKTLHNSLSYSASLYLSKLNAGFSTGKENITIPMEFGVNSYLNYFVPSLLLTSYFGLDYEKFSSYNTDQLSSGAQLSTREHGLLYVTLGLSKQFSFLRKKILLKTSLSHSLTSSSGLETEKKYSGQKYLLYLNIKATKKWSYHTFYKHHSLSGQTKLTITRVGAGLGYRF